MAAEAGATPESRDAPALNAARDVEAHVGDVCAVQDANMGQHLAGDNGRIMFRIGGLDHPPGQSVPIAFFAMAFHALPARGAG